MQIVTDLQPIEGADKIKLARVLGWQVVVKADEFKVGDRCVFFEIDSILPVAPWNDHLRKGSDKPLRVRTIRLRGQISQGVALPIEMVFPHYPELMQSLIIAGDDLTTQIGVAKYEPPAPASQEAKGNFPAFIKKTDETRLQSEPGLLEEMKEQSRLNGGAYGTLKLDGSSFTAYLNEGVFGICSRNLELKDTDGNKYWDMARALNLEACMRDWATWQSDHGFRNFAVQGELCGPGIQANRLGLLKNQLFLFNVWSITERRHFSFGTVQSFSNIYGIESVPVVFDGKFEFNTIEELLAFSDAQKYANGHPAEGVVWRAWGEPKSKILHGDRLSFKVISNQYLLKTGE